MAYEDILESILGSSGVLVALLVAVRWLVNDRNAIINELKKDRVELNDERLQRLRDIEGRLSTCETDRQNLSKRIETLHRQIATLIKHGLGVDPEDVDAMQKLENDTWSGPVKRKTRTK